MRPAPIMRLGPILGQAPPLNYLVSLPVGHPGNPEQGDGPWPVLCFLHGNFESAGYCVPKFPGRRDGRKNLNGQRYANPQAALMAHGPLKPGSALPDDSFIVVAPQLPGLEHDWAGLPAQPGNPPVQPGHLRARQVEAILGSVVGEFNADPNRVYLTGFSTGANGVYDLFTHSNRPQPTVGWAKLWPVDATTTFHLQNFPSPQHPLRCPPLWLWYGRDHNVHNRSTIRNLVGVPPGNAPADWRCSYTDVFIGPGFSGNPHVDTAIAAHRDSGAYKWLLT
jgi:predicted peptidase